MHLRDTIQQDRDTQAILFWRKVERVSIRVIYTTLAAALALNLWGMV